MSSGEDFVRFVSARSVGSAVAMFRAYCTTNGIDLLRANLYRCDADGNAVGELLTTWEKPLS